MEKSLDSEMNIKRRGKKSTFKIKRKGSKPKKRYRKGGIFILEDKPWRERYVPCRSCRHWCESIKMYIAEDGTEGWICPIKDKPRLFNKLVICKDFDDNWITAHKRSGMLTVIDERKQLGIKRRRKKK